MSRKFAPNEAWGYDYVATPYQIHPEGPSGRRMRIILAVAGGFVVFMDVSSEYPNRDTPVLTRSEADFATWVERSGATVCPKEAA